MLSKGLNLIKNNFEELFDDYKTTNNQLDTLFVGTKNSTKINIYDTKNLMI